MTTPPPTLPSYQHPPVVEVALSVRFEPLRRLTPAHMGRFWDALGPAFSEAQEATPLAPDLEHLDDQGSEPSFFFGLATDPPPSRVLLLQGDTGFLVQLQKDLFGANWRRAPGTEDPYPRFPAVRDFFGQQFDVFTEFIRSQQLGEISPTICGAGFPHPVVP